MDGTSYKLGAPAAIIRKKVARCFVTRGMNTEKE